MGLFARVDGVRREVRGVALDDRNSHFDANVGRGSDSAC